MSSQRLAWGHRAGDAGCDLLKQEVVMLNLGSQVVVQQLEGRELLVHRLRVFRLLLLHDLPPCFDHRLHLQLDLAEQLVEFL